MCHVLLNLEVFLPVPEQLRSQTRGNANHPDQMRRSFGIPSCGSKPAEVSLSTEVGFDSWWNLTKWQKTTVMSLCSVWNPRFTCTGSPRGLLTVDIGKMIRETRNVRYERTSLTAGQVSTTQLFLAKTLTHYRTTRCWNEYWSLCSIYLLNKVDGRSLQRRLMLAIKCLVKSTLASWPVLVAKRAHSVNDNVSVISQQNSCSLCYKNRTQSHHLANKHSCYHSLHLLPFSWK